MWSNSSSNKVSKRRLLQVSTLWSHRDYYKICKSHYNDSISHVYSIVVVLVVIIVVYIYIVKDLRSY